MTVWHNRESIGLRDPRSKTPFKKTPKGLVWHWEGSKVDQIDLESSKATLKAIQRSHMANAKEGYVDIAYCLAFDFLGNVFELRGFKIQGGANGTTESNADYVSVVYLGDPGDPLTDAAKQAMKSIRAEADKLGIGKENLPHSHFRQTSCPGDEIREYIANLSGSEPIPSKVQTPSAHSPETKPVFPLPAGHYYGPYNKDDKFNHSGKYNEADRPVIKFIQEIIGSPYRDGIIDTNGTTAKLIGDWQNKHGLKADRLIGQITWSALWLTPIS